jgi:hypothetical protein
VKTIKDRKSIRVCTFVFVSMLMFLLSSMIGTTVWAKPSKPGKPPSEPEKFDYQIWIGNGPLASPEDVVLQPYGEPEKDYLLVENAGYSGRWLPPSTKGKKNIEGWSIGLENPEGDYCGTYDVHKQDLIDALIANEIYPINDKDVFRFYIQHRLTLPCTGDVPPYPSEKADYWHVVIQWEVGILEIPNDPNSPMIIPHFLILSGNTNTDTVWEGVYDENADTWTVTFDNAEFELYENTTEPDDPDTGSVLNKLWDGQLSFTVEIKRTTS